jgi:hypothetical protein
MDSSGLKRAIAALALGGAVVALGGTAAEIVFAQTTQQTPPASPTTPGGPRQNGPRQDGQQQDGQQQDSQRQAREQQFLAALAAKLNVTPEQLQQAIAETRQQLGIPDRPPGGREHAGREHAGPGRGAGLGLDAAAQALGISPDQLRQELPGKSLADVARAHNVDPTTLASALKADAATHLDQEVSAGRLTADQAAQIKQGLDQRIDEQINRQVPAGPQAGGPPNGPTRGGLRPSGDSRNQPAL